MIAIDAAKQWLTPRATEPSLKFREKTIRIILPLMLVLIILAFITSVTVFNSKWALVSYPTAEIFAAVLLVLSAIAVHNGKITQAGYLLVSMFVFFSTFIVAVDVKESATFLTNYIMSLVVVALVMERKVIYIFTVLCAALIIVVIGLHGQVTNATELISNSLITLGTLAILLYNLRKEYDDKLIDAEASRRQTEQALKIAELKTQEAERANAAKSSFLSTMSHELRTPLGAIIGFLGILEMGMIKPKEEARELSATQKKMIKDIRYNAEALLTLINGILDLTRISSGRMQATLAPVNPCDESFIIGTVNSLRSLAINKEIDLELEFDPNTPTLVQCDAPQIKQVVKNLVGNAIKFTEHGKVCVQVGPLGTDQWQLTVKDTGIGIKAEALKHVFEPFYQADSTDTRAREGTGLGLAIAKSYVELHHGTLKAESVVGTGTTFTIHLPRQPEAA
jgi:signal transduction histidine kinase